jgi:uncharacterized Zn-finger protein
MMRTNTFACPYDGCGKTCTQAGHLVIHIRSHTGERPFACTHDGCGKAFAQTSNLTSHVRRHTGKRPFACKHGGCDKAFAQSGHRNRHMRTHGSLKRPRPEGVAAASAEHLAQRPWPAPSAALTDVHGLQ